MKIFHELIPVHGYYSCTLNVTATANAGQNSTGKGIIKTFFVKMYKNTVLGNKKPVFELIDKGGKNESAAKVR